MNSLNSVLLEGKVNGGISLPMYDRLGNLYQLFAIHTSKSFKVDEEYKKDVFTFSVRVYGDTAEICRQHVKHGQEVRIIGRLEQDIWGAESMIYIVADNVEFKPEGGSIPHKQVWII